MSTRERHEIINDPEGLRKLYEANRKNIWIGHNNTHYDQYIFKGILLGMDPKAINDFIIVTKRDGYLYSKEFRKISMINYDTMPNPPKGLKVIEGFMGSDIRETEVPFDLDRKLTPEEIKKTLFYCGHDVEETITEFIHTVDNFNAMFEIVKAFPDMVDIRDLGITEARITAKVIGCQKQNFHDEFEYSFLPCIKLNKYKFVMDWFEECRQEAIRLHIEDADAATKKAWYKSKSLTVMVAGIPHTFGFGGLHGAAKDPVHRNRKNGAGYHVDVNNYYPSLLLAWGLVTRAATNNNYDLVYKTRKKMKMKQLAAKDKAEAKHWKKMQIPYKKMLNALSGAMKDATNQAYDPRNNNAMCINGQLMLLMLIEMLEVIPDFELIQSNTDGLIVWLPDTDAAFEMLDDICYEWERKCSTDLCEIGLALDTISEIYQKDVNNYLWIEADGSVGESIGAYVKGLSPIDYDLPIVNKAVVDYMSKGIPVENTIMECDELKEFQKIVKLSDKYSYVTHEEGTATLVRTVKHKNGTIDTFYSYDGSKTYSYKCYRVFASKNLSDGRLLKWKDGAKNGEKFENTSMHSFIMNESMDGVTCPAQLDKEWYIRMAKNRLKDFGLEVAYG